MIIKSICTGEIVSIESVPDVVFSERYMGDGIAFIPHTNTIVSPVDGIITNVYITGHALVIKTLSGSEILIHFGLNSYTIPHGIIKLHIDLNEEVKSGQLLMTIDLDFFEKYNLNIITPLVFLSKEIVNFDRFEKMLVREGEHLEGLVSK